MKRLGASPAKAYTRDIEAERIGGRRVSRRNRHPPEPATHVEKWAGFMMDSGAKLQLREQNRETSSYRKLESLCRSRNKDQICQL